MSDQPKLNAEGLAPDMVRRGYGGSKLIGIPNAPGNPYREREDLHYDFAADKTTCPVCGKVGVFPWHGWGTCDICNAVMVVEDGRVFESMAEGV